MACPCCVPCFDVHACPGQPYIFPSPGTPCPSGCTCSQCCNTCKPKQSINVDIQGDDPSSHLNGTYVLNLLTWQCSNSDLWYYFEGVPYALDCTSIIGFPQMFDVVPRITVRNNHPFYGSSAFSVQSANSPAALNDNLFRCCIFPTNCQLGTSDGPGFTPFVPPAPSDWFCEGVSFDVTIRPRWFNYSGTVRIYS
jgi:hypothetical protein